MIETVTRKRIEILTDKAYVPRLTAAIDSVGITGWTIVPVSSGKGRDGEWREESVMGTDKVFVLSIASEERAEALAETNQHPLQDWRNCACLVDDEL